MTMDKFQEQQDLIESERKRSIVRRESIAAIPTMNREQKANIRDRIFNNNSITTATANLASRHSNEVLNKAKFARARADSMVGHYMSGIQEFNRKMTVRLKKITGPTIPRGPNLRTMERSQSRSIDFSRKQAGSKYQKPEKPLPPGAVKHLQPFNINVRRSASKSECFSDYGYESLNKHHNYYSTDFGSIAPGSST